MLLDGETLRRIGRGNGLDIIAASKSWIARQALCAPPQLLAKDEAALDGLRGNRRLDTAPKSIYDLSYQNEFV